MENTNFNKILKKEIDNEKLKKILLYFLAFFIPALILIVIFLWQKVEPFGDNIYLPVDASGQYANYLQYFKGVFFEDNGIFYSLKKSLGGEMYGLFAYYLLSPYNLIVLFFKKINVSFVVILILKTATCGITFMYYLNRRKKEKLTNLIFSTMYALCSYTITYGFNIMWLDSVILLPLVISGIEDVIEYKRTNLYIITISLTLITNYYIGFMVCLFSGIYFIYKLLIGNLKNKKEILKKIGIFILSSIVAVMIASFILIPIFKGIQKGRADFSFETINFEKNFGIKNLVSKIFTNTFDIEEIKNKAMPPLFCGMFANILIVIYFLNKNITIREKILSIIMLMIFAISFYLQGANLLWSMGNIPAWYKYRYGFIFCFIYIIFSKRRI